MRHYSISAGSLPDDLKISHGLAKTSAPDRTPSRRSLLRQIAFAGVSLMAEPALAEQLIKLPLPSDPRERPLSHDFPQ